MNLEQWEVKEPAFTHEQYCSLSSSRQLNGIACAGKAKNDADYFKWIVKNVK